jgi:hypothetical protein
MKRATLLLFASLIAGGIAGSAGQPVAAAKGPAAEVAHASAVLALVGGEVEQAKLVWLNPRTLKRIGRESVLLGGNAFSPVLSPTGGRVAVGGSSTDGIRIADVFRMKLLSRLARRSGSWMVSPIAWPAAHRLIALEWNDRAEGQAGLVVLDPSARRVVRRTQLGGYAGSVAVAGGQDVVLVGGQSEGIGPAHVLVAGADGVVRGLVLDRVLAGGEQVGPDEETWRTASPGVAVDSTGRRAFVVGEAPVVAEIDLDSLGVTYRDLSRSASFLDRLHAWLEPAADAKSLVGWSRQAVWLGDGLLAVAGTEYDRLASRPSGLEIIDVNSGSTRTVEPDASFSTVSQGILVTGGAASDGTTEAQSGMGLSGFTSAGSKLWSALKGQPVWSAEAAGGYAYVAGPDAYPRKVRVVDLATGEVRTVRGEMPFFITP